jgi:dihydroorotate dehydrogenase electron transfer subunit
MSENMQLMKKYSLDVIIVENKRINGEYAQIKFTGKDVLPEMQPGQFAEVKINGSPSTFLRRPFSINFFDRKKNEAWLLVRITGEGSRALANIRVGASVNMLLPLGKPFTQPGDTNARPVLIGGGFGAAPLLYLGANLNARGIRPAFLLGARSRNDILQLDEFKKYGDIYITTEDGSLGEKGIVTHHSVLHSMNFDHIYTCGPKPMMMAVATCARKWGIFCEVSLENTMACGFGVCLCCVENTCEGYMCVCKEGPVFNIEKLLW